MSTSATPANVAEALAARQAKRAANSAKRQGESEKLRLEGNNLFKQGDFVGACNFYVKAIHLQGPKPVLLSNLAAGYLKLGLYEEAEWAASTALDYEPGNLKARYRRAMARKNLKFYTAALVDLDAIVEEDPSQSEANRELEALYLLLDSEEGLEDSDFLERPPEEPYIDDEGKDLSSDSDTSDCLHVGNGIPCRFYNHAGCGRGSDCQFSHAPDDRSVRDGLGKNVCTKMIFERCKFGDAKCVYSHDPTHLPAGSMYADPEKMATAKLLQPFLEADIKADPEMNAIFRANQAGVHPGRRRRDGFFDYIDSMHSQAIRDIPPFKVAASSKPAPGRFILLLSLEDEDFYADICAHVYAALRSKAKVVQAKNTTDALRALASPDLIGVFVTDAGITRRPNNSVLTKLVEYVRAGGVTVIGGMFGNHVTRNTMDRFFKNSWGVGWVQGSYHRTTFSVNPQNEIASRNPSLHASYSMKALHVGNISPEMAVYSPTENSRLESLVFGPSPIEDKSESPAVTTKVGKGWLGYLGDINAEMESTNTILAMLGLLDAPHEPPSSPAEAASASTSTSVPAAGSSTSTPDPKPLRKGKDKEPEQPSSSAFAHKNQPKVPQSQMGGGEPDKKFVLIIILEFDKMFLKTHSTQVDVLTEKSAIKLGLSTPSSLSHMSSPSLGGVYITDGGLARPENSEVLDAVVQYARGGGLVVIGGLCPTLENREQLEHIFSAFGLEWKVGARSTTEVYLNHGHHAANRNRSLPDSYVTEVTSVASYHPEALLYRQTALGGSQAPIARTPVGQGFVGYIGDHRGGSNPTIVLLAMLNLLDGPQALEPDSQKFVLVLSFSSASAQQYEETCKDFFADMKTKVEVLHGLSKARVIDLLPSRDLAGVFVTHAAIAYPEQEYLLAKLVEYVRNGGTVVFGGHFSDIITITEMLPFFRDNFGLPWDLVGSIDANMVQNTKNEIFKKHPTLPSSFYLEARYIKGIAPSMSLYIPQNRPHAWKPKLKIFQSGVAYADVGKGHVGYLGITVPDGEVRSILYAMLGIL